MKGFTGVVLFVSGAVLGAVGSLFYLRKEFNKKVEEEVAARDMAIRELKRQKAESDREADNANRRFDNKVATELSKRLGYSVDNVSALTRNAPTTHSEGSQRASRDREDVIYSVNENGEVEDYPSEKPNPIPYGLSSIDDFLLSHKEYDKTTLTWYDKDGVLATENGDVVEDVLFILGPDWQSEIGRLETGIAYIRNERAGTDYEVVVEDKKYTEDWAT